MHNDITYLTGRKERLVVGPGEAVQRREVQLREDQNEAHLLTANVHR